MNREEFLKSLEDCLDIFTEEEKKKEINKYIKNILEKKNSGLSEEDIIKDMGSISDIHDKILLEHGIDPKKVKKNGNFFYRKFEELFQVIHRVVDVMSKNNFQENVKIILDILVLIFFICIIKIPFILVRNLGDNLLQMFNMPIILTLWGYVIDILYVIVAVMVFMNIFTKWFKNLKGKKDKKLKGKSLEAITLKED